jgi:hypothetical protein
MAAAAALLVNAWQLLQISSMRVRTDEHRMNAVACVLVRLLAVCGDDVSPAVLTATATLRTVVTDLGDHPCVMLGVVKLAMFATGTCYSCLQWAAC